MDPDVWFREGRRLFEERRFEESRALFERVVQAVPGHAEAHYGLGLSLFSLGRLDEAEVSFRAALKHNPRYADAWFQLGAIAERRQDRQAAIEAYKQALEINPSHGARNRLQVLSPPTSNVTQSGASPGREFPPVTREQLRFWPAEIGVVSGLVPRSEPDPDLPLLPAFERPTVHSFVFELVREGQPSLSVEMRGAKLRGLPPRNDDRIAIPAEQNEHGRYQIDRFQRLSDPQEEVVMEPRVDEAAIRRVNWVTKMRTYRPFAMAGLMIGALFAFVLFVLPEIRNSERENNERHERWKQEVEADQRRFEREVRKQKRLFDRKMRNQEQALEQARQQSQLLQGAAQQRAEEAQRRLEQQGAEAQRRFEREGRQVQQRFEQEARQSCLNAGLDEAVCNDFP